MTARRPFSTVAPDGRSGGASGRGLSRGVWPMSSRLPSRYSMATASRRAAERGDHVTGEASGCELLANRPPGPRLGFGRVTVAPPARPSYRQPPLMFAHSHVPDGAGLHRLVAAYSTYEHYRPLAVPPGMPAFELADDAVPGASRALAHDLTPTTRALRLMSCPHPVHSTTSP